MSKAATLAGFATSIIPPNDLIVGIVTATSLSVGNQTVSSLGVGISTEGGSVGTGATVLDFRGAGISTVTVSSGIATVNITGGGGGGGASVTTSDTAPVSPSDGDLWYDSVGGRMYVYYDDGDTSQWVDSAPQGGGNAFSAKIEVGNTKAEVTDTGSDGAFVVTTEGTERLRVDSAGRLLVGPDTAPSYRLTSSLSSTGTSISSFATTDIALGLVNTGGATINQTLPILFRYADGTYNGNGLFAAIRESGTGRGQSFLFAPSDVNGNPAERMRITSAGVLLYGKTSDDLSVNGWAIRSNGTSQLATNVAGGPVQRLNHNGGTATEYLIECWKNGSQKGSISVTSSATSYNTSSDYRLKENVVPLTGAADRLKQLSVHRFNFIEDPDNTVDGFLAHEAQDVVPECVTGTKDEVDAEGNPVYQGIDQSKLVPLLTAALQEALTKIETLETQNASLEARLTALEGGN